MNKFYYFVFFSFLVFLPCFSQPLEIRGALKANPFEHSVRNTLVQINKLDFVFHFVTNNSQFWDRISETSGLYNLMIISNRVSHKSIITMAPLFNPEYITQVTSNLVGVLWGNGGNCHGCVGYRYFRFGDLEISEIISAHPFGFNGFLKKHDRIYFYITTEVPSMGVSHADTPNYNQYYLYSDEKITRSYDFDALECERLKPIFKAIFIKLQDDRNVSPKDYSTLVLYCRYLIEFNRQKEVAEISKKIFKSGSLILKAYDSPQLITPKDFMGYFDLDENGISLHKKNIFHKVLQYFNKN